MPSPTTSKLPDPAFYFPPTNGRYSVAPGLTHLSVAEFGNGSRDRFLFQFDNEFQRFKENKRIVRAGEHSDRNRGRAHFDPEVEAAVVRLIVERLASEHPDRFSIHTRSDGAVRLWCSLTGESLSFDRKARFVPSDSNPTDEGGFHALCGQFAEDIVIVRRGLDRGDWIAAIDVCAPSHWAPEEKLGRSFDATHAPVPGMERSRAAAAGLVDAMINRPPTLRFTWGIEFSNRLNTHPSSTYEPRRFAHGSHVADAPLFFRVERQTIWGMPEVEAALFAIRVYIYDCREVIDPHPERREALAAAMRSMPAESRIYKGLAPAVFEEVLRRFDP